MKKNRPCRHRSVTFLKICVLSSQIMLEPALVCYRKQIGFQVLDMIGRNYPNTAPNPFRFGLLKLYTTPKETCMSEGNRRSFDIQILKFSIFHVENVNKT